MIKIAWDDVKQNLDDFLPGDWNDMVTDQKSRSSASSGAGVPTSTPSSVGDIYVDTTNLKVYMATGTTNAADWKKVLTQ